VIKRLKKVDIKQGCVVLLKIHLPLSMTVVLALLQISNFEWRGLLELDYNDGWQNPKHQALHRDGREPRD
jgi:hypothetical protein